MTTIWRTRTGAEGLGPIEDVSAEFCHADGSDGVATLIQFGKTIPDWVRMPEELGGKELKVTGEDRRAIKCLKCSEEVPMEMLWLEDGFGVAHCYSCNSFNWIKQPEEKASRS